MSIRHLFGGRTLRPFLSGNHLDMISYGRDRMSGFHLWGFSESRDLYTSNTLSYRIL